MDKTSLDAVVSDNTKPYTTGLCRLRSGKLPVAASMLAAIALYAAPMTAKAADFVVSGKVVNQQNTGIPGVEVTYKRANDGTATTTTDANGDWMFTSATATVPPTWSSIKVGPYDSPVLERSNSNLNPKSTSGVMDTVFVNTGGAPFWSATVPVPTTGNIAVNAMLASDDISYDEFYQIHRLDFTPNALLFYNAGNTDPETAFPLKYELLPSAPNPSSIRDRLAEFETAMGRDYFEEVVGYDFTTGIEGGLIFSGPNTTPTTTFASAGVTLPIQYHSPATAANTLLLFQMKVNTSDAQKIYHEATRALGVRGTISEATRNNSIFNPQGDANIAPEDVELINYTYDLNQFDLNNKTISIIPTWAEYSQ